MKIKHDKYTNHQTWARSRLFEYYLDLGVRTLKLDLMLKAYGMIN